MNFNRCFFYNRCCFSPDYSMYSPTNIIRLSLSIRLFAFHLPLVLTFFIDYWENFVSCYSTWNIFKCSSPIRKKKEREWKLCKDQFPQRNETNPYLIAFKTIRIHVVSKFKFVGSRGWGRDTCCFFFILHRNSRHPVYPTLVNNSTLYIWIPLTYPACHLGNLHSPFYATRTHAHARAWLLTRSRFVYLCVEHALGTHIVRIRGTRRPWILLLLFMRCNVGFNGGPEKRERGGSERGIRKSWSSASGDNSRPVKLVKIRLDDGFAAESSVVSKNRVKSCY